MYRRAAYVVLDKSGHVVGIDMNSGGYPFDTDDINEWKFFYKEEDAQEYASKFVGFSVSHVYIQVGMSENGK